MTAEGHVLFALASVILAKKINLSTILTQGDWWHLISGSIMTCLLPDIDHPRSFIGRRLSFISKIIVKIFGHRGFTHSFLAVFTIMAILTILKLYKIIISMDVLYSMIIGYLSHIIGDILTPAGVPLFWPYRWRFYIPILHSNNNIERYICMLVLIFAIQHPQGEYIIYDLCSNNQVHRVFQQVKNKVFNNFFYLFN